MTRRSITTEFSLQSLFVGVISRYSIPGGYGELHRRVDDIKKTSEQTAVLHLRVTGRAAEGRMPSGQTAGCPRYFFRSTRKGASAFNVSAREPKVSSDAKAVSTNVSACLSDSSIP